METWRSMREVNDFSGLRELQDVGIGQIGASDCVRPAGDLAR